MGYAGHVDRISRSRGWDKKIPHCVLPMEQLVLSDKWARNFHPDARNTSRRPTLSHQMSQGAEKFQPPEVGIEPGPQDLKANTLPRRCKSRLLLQGSRSVLCTYPYYTSCMSNNRMLHISHIIFLSQILMLSNQMLRYSCKCIRIVYFHHCQRKYKGEMC